MAAGKKISQEPYWESLGSQGFTLLELIIVVGVMGLLSAIAIPAASSYYGKCRVEAAAAEITGMIREAKQNALDGNYYAIGFDPVNGKFSLLSGRGADGEWNTADDIVVRTCRLAAKGGGLTFGHGSYGPVPDHAPAADGISFGNNTLVCNPELTGNGGSVYLRSSSGAAIAITMNSTDFGYKLYSWNGGRWVRR